MIYVCMVARNQAATVGLALWKLRKVFQEFPREYQILMVDDGSSDGTAETLETYQRALPMTLVRHPTPRGNAAALDTLFRQALAKTDRPKRDLAVVIPCDFSVSPAVVPELVKRFESGADVVVAEVTGATRPWLVRLLARLAPWLLQPGLRVAGVRDFLSGAFAVRLVTLRNALSEVQPLAERDGAPVHAELVARTAAAARQVASVRWEERSGRIQRLGLGDAVALALRLFRLGRRVTIRPAAELEGG